MYLYGDNGSNIDVFEIKPNKERIIAFKKEELEKVPIDVRFLYAYGNIEILQAGQSERWDNVMFDDGYTTYHRLDVYDTTSNIEEHQKKSVFEESPKILSLEEQEKLLKEYYDGAWDEPWDGYGNKGVERTVIITHNQFGIDIDSILGVEYVLLTEGYDQDYDDTYSMGNIITITRPLYLYSVVSSALISRKYHKILNDYEEYGWATCEEMTPIFQYFDISKNPCATFSEDMLANLFKYKLLDYIKDSADYSQFLDDLKESGEVLKIALKHSNKIL